MVRTSLITPIAPLLGVVPIPTILPSYAPLESGSLIWSAQGETPTSSYGTFRVSGDGTVTRETRNGVTAWRSEAPGVDSYRDYLALPNPTGVLINGPWTFTQWWWFSLPPGAAPISGTRWFSTATYLVDPQTAGGNWNRIVTNNLAHKAGVFRQTLYHVPTAGVGYSSELISAQVFPEETWVKTITRQLANQDVEVYQQVPGVNANPVLILRAPKSDGPTRINSAHFGFYGSPDMGSGTVIANADLELRAD